MSADLAVPSSAANVTIRSLKNGGHGARSDSARRLQSAFHFFPAAYSEPNAATGVATGRQVG
jgi:hypothetical protein